MSNGDYVRPPLGLPPGSIRGILSLLIVTQFWLLLLLPEQYKVPIPINLYLLMTLVAVFFVSHGKSITSAGGNYPSPLYLPGGTLRLIIIAGTALVIGYLYMNHPERLEERLRPAEGQFAQWPLLIGAYVGGFLLGYVFRFMPFRHFWAFQAFQAWLSMIAMALLFAEVIIQAFINPSLKNEGWDLHKWEAIVTAVTAWYFGTRS
jgi:hypothetical protein